MPTTKVEGVPPDSCVFSCAYACRKYGADGKQLEKWSGDDAEGKRKEKEEASELFKGYWRRCTADAKYLELKKQWQKEKKQYKPKS